MRTNSAFHSRYVCAALAMAAAASTAFGARSAQAQCAFNPPTNDVPGDAEEGLPLLYPGKLNVFHVYWSSDWDGDPANFRRADIETAMKAVIGSPYFDRLCQYGVPGFQWEGTADTSGFFNPCLRNPGSMTSTLGLLAFMSCSEYSLGTGVPNALGVPNPLTCPVCGPLPIDCFDPIAASVILGNPVAGAAAAALCVATPNPTGNRIYVLFLPKGTVIDDFGRRSCVPGSYDAFHFQIPSRSLFFPGPPFVIPGTQGRPVNIAIIPTECFSSVGEMMKSVTHELVEAATDPLPLAHWLDESTEPRPGTSRLDLSNVETLLTKGEISDVCNGTFQTLMVGSTGIEVADYWSNHDNMCLSIDVTPPVTTATVAPPASGGWHRGDVDVTLTANDEPGGSGVKQIVFDATGAGALAEATVPGSTAMVTISAEGITTLRFSAEDNAGNTEVRHNLLLRIDRTPPVIAAAAAPAPNAAGWNNTDVTVTFTCTDSLSGIAHCPGPLTLSADGANQSASGTASDVAGNTSSTSVTGIDIDRTPPTVTYAGNAGTYTVDQNVDIVCTAADNLSGIASTTCSDVHQPAYVFPLGTNTLSANATDVAGNTAGASTSFSVLVTGASLCTLSARFSGSAAIAHSLCVKLADIESAPTPGARAGRIAAFIHEVDAQTGNTLSAADAAILISLANAL
jgi:hypothetical protein